MLRSFLRTAFFLKPPAVTLLLYFLFGLPVFEKALYSVTRAAAVDSLIDLVSNYRKN